MKTLFLIAGESGSGKDTLVNLMCEKHNMKKLISYTTRKKREGEDAYVYIDKNDIKNYSDIVAYTEINGAVYFTTKNRLKDIDFYIIDKHGILSVKELFKKDEDFRIVTIYINVPFYNRCSRAIRRGDKKQAFLDRSNSEREQFEALRKEALFDYAIKNITLHKALEVLECIVRVERGEI